MNKVDNITGFVQLPFRSCLAIDFNSCLLKVITWFQKLIKIYAKSIKIYYYKCFWNQFEKNIDIEVSNVVEWLKKTFDTTGAKGCVLGMSGGIDCSCVAALLHKANIPLVLLKMPYGKSMDYAGDNKDADELIEKFGFKCETVDITGIVDSLVNTIEDSVIGLSNMAKTNINPRIRMTTLYSVGQTMGYLVIGTGNLSEITMGYSTKWGDSACDLNPLARFTKTEVRIMAKYLGVPESIIKKAPSANLWEGQTDEEEMGITYYDLDRYILTGEGSEKIKDKIECTKRKVSHKYVPIPIYKRI
ncbi:NAD(+) synthase [Clostridium perfringens]